MPSVAFVDAAGAASAPTVTAARIAADWRAVVIHFSVNVDGPANCAAVFTPESLEVLGGPTECAFAANRLRVKLGAANRVEDATEIAFKVGNGVVARGAANGTEAAAAEGVTLRAKKGATNRDGPSFSVRVAQQVVVVD